MKLSINELKVLTEALENVDEHGKTLIKTDSIPNLSYNDLLDVAVDLANKGLVVYHYSLQGFSAKGVQLLITQNNMKDIRQLLSEVY